MIIILHRPKRKMGLKNTFNEQYKELTPLYHNGEEPMLFTMSFPALEVNILVVSKLFSEGK